MNTDADVSPAIIITNNPGRSKFKANLLTITLKRSFFSFQDQEFSVPFSLFCCFLSFSPPEQIEQLAKFSVFSLTSTPGATTQQQKQINSSKFPLS